MSLLYCARVITLFQISECNKSTLGYLKTSSKFLINPFKIDFFYFSYRKGGPLTITDANLVLGRLLPDYFPKIFGPKEDQSLDKVAALEAFEKVTLEVNEFMKTNMSVEGVAMGFVKVANETMCRYDFDHEKKYYHEETIP